MSGWVGDALYIRFTAAVTASRSFSGILSEIDVNGLRGSMQLHIIISLKIPYFGYFYCEKVFAILLKIKTMQKFKTHMILFADSESFVTLCGIDDGCSESFNDQNPLVPFGYEKETTCKKCIAKYQNLLKIEEENQKQYELSQPAL